MLTSLHSVLRGQPPAPVAPAAPRVVRPRVAPASVGVPAAATAGVANKPQVVLPPPSRAPVVDEKRRVGALPPTGDSVGCFTGFVSAVKALGRSCVSRLPLRKGKEPGSPISAPPRYTGKRGEVTGVVPAGRLSPTVVGSASRSVCGSGAASAVSSVGSSVLRGVLPECYLPLRGEVLPGRPSVPPSWRSSSTHGTASYDSASV